MPAQAGLPYFRYARKQQARETLQSRQSHENKVLKKSTWEPA
jgi:hypothetical protein